VTGQLGSGKTAELIDYLRRRASQGAEIWAADPKRIQLAPIREWSQVTRFATRVPGMIQLIEDAHAEMERRYELFETGSGCAPRALVVAVGEWPAFTALLRSWQAEHSPPTAHPIWRKAEELLILGSPAGVSLAISAPPESAHNILRGSGGNIQHVQMPCRHTGAAVRPRGRTARALVALTRRRRPHHPAACRASGRDMARAVKRAETAAAHVLPRVEVTPLEWAEQARRQPAGGDGAAAPLRRFAVRYAPTAKVTPDGNRELIRRHMSLQLYGDPDLLRASWQICNDIVTFWVARQTGTSLSAQDEDAQPEARRFLLILRLALRCRTAHLTAGPEAPPTSASAARYGWQTGPDDQPAPSGPCIGSAVPTATGRRIYLHPGAAFGAAATFAAELRIPFSYTRAQIETALHSSGLLETEKDSGAGTRRAVRRPLPGRGNQHIRVWSVPEDAVLGDDQAEAGKAEGARRG